MVVLDTGSDWLLTVFKHCRLQTHSACSGLWSLLWRKKQSGQIQMMEFLQKYCWQCSTAINICKSPGKRKNDQAWMREAKASQQVRRHILHFLAFDHCSEEKKHNKVRFRCWSFYRTTGTAQLQFTFATHQANGKNTKPGYGKFEDTLCTFWPLIIALWKKKTQKGQIQMLEFL